jgi:ABC-2 type transport system ATP-binding protein
VAENLRVYGHLYDVPRLDHRIAELATELQLDDLLDRPAGKLSAGQKTRVGLAKALLNAPDLLLLDEPTASLDPDTADWVRRKLKDYAETRGSTLLLASQNMAEDERLADRVILLHQGRIIEDDTPAGLIATYGRRTLEEVFLDVVRGHAKREAAAPARKAS